MAFTSIPDVEISHLQFDPNNPRYLPYRKMDTSKEENIARGLYQTADLKELIQSISENGYINIEPLIVMKDAAKQDYFIVLEGNRRLAALKLLSDDNFAALSKIENLPTLSPDQKLKLSKVTVTCVDDKNEARPLIGFKHINGPQRWDSFAKAKYVKAWFEDKDAGDHSIKKISQSLGDGHDTIKRLIFGLYVLEQAEAWGIFSIEDRYPETGFAFSHLYTALSKKGYQDYLGIATAWTSIEPAPSPVPEDKKSNLSDVMLWLYGSKSSDIRPVIGSQNPDLKNLSLVLESATATKILKATQNLKTALDDITPPSTHFETALIKANQFSEEAAGKVALFDPRATDLIEIADQLQKRTRAIYASMRDLASEVEKK